MVFLTACASSQTPTSDIVVQTRVEVPVVPNSVLTCPAVPSPPNVDTATQRDVAVYIPELAQVAEHCSRDLATVRRILKDASAQ